MRYMILFFALTSCYSEKFNPLNPSKVNAFFYGDSIMRSSEPTPEQFGSYPALICKDRGWEVNQYAIGATFSFSSNQFPALMQDIWPLGSVVFFDCGLNDAICLNVNPVYGVYRDNLRKVLQRLKSMGMKTYVGTPTRMATNVYTRWGGNVPIDLYAQIVREEVSWVNAPNIRLVDFCKEWSPTMVNTADGLHPNDVGCRELADIFLKIGYN